MVYSRKAYYNGEYTICKQRMNTKLENIKTELIETIADCQSGIGDITQQSVFTYGVSLYKNPDIIGDTQLQQSVSLINSLDNQLKNGNDDVITPEVIKEIFTNILQKLTTGIVSKK